MTKGQEAVRDKIVTEKEVDQGKSQAVKEEVQITDQKTLSHRPKVMPKWFWGVIAVVVVAVGIFVFFSVKKGDKKFSLIPKGKRQVSETMIGTTEVGTGWSGSENPEEAAEEAVAMALENKQDKTPDLAIIFASSVSDLQVITLKVKELLGEEIRMYGGTSDSRGVMTNKGFVEVSDKGYEYGMKGRGRGLVIMTVSSEDIVFGVGSADFAAYASAQEAAKAAVLGAIESAGKSEGEIPDVVLVTPTKPDEDDTLDGIEQVVGKDTPILGGSAGGPEFGVVGEDVVYEKGVSLAVIYTDLPVGWTFEGGFEVKDPHTGLVTKVDGRSILEIDNRPALDVYDDWLDGEVDRLYAEHEDPRIVKNLLTLHPLYRKYTTETGQEYFLFSHPWPTDPTQEEKGVSTSTNIKVGDRVYLSHGTWEILINRIGNLPKNAKIRADISSDQRPVLGIGYICAGVMGTIPEKDREKMATLLNNENNDAPFIATFTWGEQGLLPGVGNKHGNLLTSFLVIGP